MFCKNCGTQLTGTENVCPNCGVTIEKEDKIEELTVEETQAAITPEVVTPAPVVETPAPVTATPAPAVQPAPAINQVPTANPNAAVPTQTQQPKNNTTLILVIILVGLLVAGSIIFFALNMKNNQKEPTTSNEPTTQTEPTEPTTKDPTTPTDPTTPDPTNPVSSTTDNTVKYSGYTFTIPEGYKAEQDSEYGLLIGNDKIIYSISLDYTNSYEKYKEALAAKYPEDYKEGIETIGGREYIIIKHKSSTSQKLVSEYVTKATTSTTFVGMIVRSDGYAATRTDYTELSTILKSASTNSSFAAEEKKDSGTNGVIDYNGVDPDNILGKLK